MGWFVRLGFTCISLSHTHIPTEIHTHILLWIPQETSWHKPGTRTGSPEGECAGIFKSPRRKLVSLSCVFYAQFQRLCVLWGCCGSVVKDLHMWPEDWDLKSVMLTGKCLQTATLCRRVDRHLSGPLSNALEATKNLRLYCETPPGSVSLSEERYIYPLLHTWAHQGPWLVRLTVIDRWESLWYHFHPLRIFWGLCDWWLWGCFLLCHSGARLFSMIEN